jgi:hypothetical protein
VTFDFSFDLVHRAFGLPFGITPGTTQVEVDGDRLMTRFGLWRLSTSLDNVEGTQVTGPYSTFKTVGPAHLSVADRGVTFATNSRRGLCIRFRDAVPAIEPTGRLRHPAVTVTVADVDGLATVLAGG